MFSSKEEGNNQKSSIFDDRLISTHNLKLRCGVPQGSVLGPLKFILNMNNMRKIRRTLQTTDNNRLRCCGNDLEQLQNVKIKYIKNLG